MAEPYVMNADGSGQTRLTTTGRTTGVYLQPAWSPDGSRIAFNLAQGDLYLINPDGTGLSQLVPNGRHPAWSPDGTRIAYTSGSEIYLVNSDGSGLTNLTDDPAGDFLSTWSPDGTRIAFESVNRDGGTNGLREIYVMNADGSGQTNLSNTPLAREAFPKWRP